MIFYETESRGNFYFRLYVLSSHLGHGYWDLNGQCSEIFKNYHTIEFLVYWPGSVSSEFQQKYHFSYTLASAIVAKSSRNPLSNRH